MGIDEEDLAGGEEEPKTKIKKTLSYLKEQITRSGNYKMKVQHLLEGMEDWKPGHRPIYISKPTRHQVSTIFQDWKPGHRPIYISKPTRHQVSTIFQGRKRMLKVKNNCKKGEKDVLCIICKTTDETQQHILEECWGLHPDDLTKVTKEDLFNDKIPKLTEIAKQIQITINTLEHAITWSLQRWGIYN